MRGRLALENRTSFHHSACEANTVRSLASQLRFEARLLKKARRRGSEVRLLPEMSLFSQCMRG